MLTSDAALILLGALVVFTAVTERGRAALEAAEPWIVAVALALFLFLHLLWLQGMGEQSDAGAGAIARSGDGKPEHLGLAAAARRACCSRMPGSPS